MCYREKSDFEEKGLDKDVVEVRYKHHKVKLMENMNAAVTER